MVRKLPFLACAALVCSCASMPSFESSLQLDREVDILRADGVPAVGLAVVSCEGGSMSVGGVRQLGSGEAAPENARFNIGSNAKSMLATVAARLEAEGHLDFDDTLGELWPQAAVAAPDKAGITLAQFLSHESGLPAFDTGAALEAVPEFRGTDEEVRSQAALFFLRQPLETPPGTSVVYSNAGYVVAAAVLEEVTGTPLPRLLDEGLFRPLRISGELGEPRRLDPEGGLFGHYQTEGRIELNDAEEPPVPVFLEGAGNVSLSTADYARYVQTHLCALQGQSAYLGQNAARRLHGRGRLNGTGLGWGATEIGGTDVSFHVGGTGDFTAYMAVSEDQNKAAIAVMNIGGGPASGGLRWLIEEMTPPTDG